MADYAQVVYDHIHTLGNVGDEVRIDDEENVAAGASIIPDADEVWA